MMEWAQYGYWGLFAVSFGAATILPISSEILLLSFLYAGLDGVTCVLFASLGNWLGGMFTYYLGWLGKTEWLIKYFKISRHQVDKAQVWAKYKYAEMSAFLCFLPAIGDVIAFVLGMFRVKPTAVAAYMFSGKFLRYILLLYGFKYGVEWLL